MVANKVNIRKNGSCTKQKILITKTAAFCPICYLIWRRIKQKRAKRKRTKSMWVSRPLFLERRSRSKGLLNILIKDLWLFDHFYFLFRALFVLVFEST